MRALSLTQPWATLVAVGAKQLETRSWPTTYRGELAIHASSRFPRDCKDLCHDEPFLSALTEAGIGRVTDLPIGAIVAVATLTDCIWITHQNAPGGDEYLFGDYTPGRFMLRLENVLKLDRPVPAKGALGFWTMPEEVERVVREQIA